MSFTAITTQEEFDKAITARLQRERETLGKQHQTQIAELEEKIRGFESQIAERDQKITGFENQLAERDQTITGFNDQIADLNKQIEAASGQDSKIKELETQIKAYETSSAKMRIAREMGLQDNLVEFFTGEDENAIRESAEKLKKAIGVQTVAPLGNPDIGDRKGDETEKAWAKVAQEMKGE